MGHGVGFPSIHRVALIVWLADNIDSIGDGIKSFSEVFFKPFAVAACVSNLILLEPDYGTAIFLGGVALSLLFLYGSRVSYVAGAVAIALVSVSIVIFLNPVRMRRILAFIDINANKLGGRYQLWQGILGFAFGGLWGNGLRNRKQQLVYLPEAHMSFMLLILGEEFSSVTVISVMILYFVFDITCIIPAMRTKCTYRSAISCGIALLVARQVIINVGVVSGLLPTKGMALPFICYGGSNLLVMYFMLGVLLNCFFHDQKSLKN
jgi:cell division protein FtsW